MRSVTVSGGIQTFITLREGKWLDEHEIDRVAKDDLTEREQVIAQQLVHKGVLNKIVEDKKVFYTRNINRFKS